ncbi:MAG: S8 family serine peptidase [Candidatus Symbiothrix sp.]|jgi:subtilisin family serine protease|nr:S8 family serine peptidase [Candidatus Symbiothrix sp.]
MKKHLICPALIFLFCLSVQAQESVFYRLILTDKGTSSDNINRPQDFLSQKSIDRRIRQGFPVDETDLPVSPAYFEALTETGVSIQTYSKWLKTIVVNVPDEETLALLEKLPFVANLYPVFRGNIAGEETEAQTETEQASACFQSNIPDYGAGFTQISLNNGHRLHQLGYRGQNKTIAVMDAGFSNVDRIDCFNQGQILGVKNFTHEKGTFFRESMDHGTKVLSCMLANKPGYLIGTAPDAEYYLFKTEVNGSEFPIEEDYWVAALEYADSLGVDVVSTSLGYFTFDDATMNHTHEQLDGNSILVSRAAAMAAYKGMALCNSAGNEGNKDWGKIIFPADAENILTVGSVQSDSIRSSFSSFGYSSDNRVKPDIMAMGTLAAIIGSNGRIASGSGTSFSCPIISGLVASLWQALPHLNSLELIDLIRKTADRYQYPDSLYGYGIADFFNAYEDGKSGVSIPRNYSPDALRFQVNDNKLYISSSSEYPQARLFIFTSMGVKRLEQPVSSACIDLRVLNKGIYIARLQQGDKHYVRKFVKQ